MAIISGSGTV